MKQYNSSKAVDLKLFLTKERDVTIQDRILLEKKISKERQLFLAKEKNKDLNLTK